jgi:hypothetical protein
MTPHDAEAPPPATLEQVQAKLADARKLCGELLESLRLASTTSDGYRDAHAAYQRWAARLAPDAIGDEAKRAAIAAGQGLAGGVTTKRARRTSR